MNLNFIDSLFYIFFDFFTRGVSIGLSKKMDKAQRHGVAWVERPTGGAEPYPFLADRPSALVRPNIFTIHSMFSQLRDMGFYPNHIEIMVGNKRRVYKFGRWRAILVQ